MKSTSYRFLKLNLTYTVVLFWIVGGMAFVFGDVTRTPSIDIGGPNLIVNNDTDYVLQIDDVTWTEPNGSNYYAEKYGIKQRVSVTLFSYGYDRNSRQYQRYWGAPGQKSGGLTIHSQDGRWGNADNNGEIKVTLEKGKAHYEGVFNVDVGCNDLNSCECTKIDWSVDWQKDGWKIHLKQRVEDYGCR